MPKNDENRWDYMENELPVCPHCDSSTEAILDALSRLTDSDAEDIDCPNCGKEFEVTAHVEYSTDYTLEQKDLMDAE